MIHDDQFIFQRCPNYMEKNVQCTHEDIMCQTLLNTTVHSCRLTTAWKVINPGPTPFSPVVNSRQLSLAQVSFSDPCCPVLCCFHYILVNFSHFVILQNQEINFSQTLHKASFSEGDSSLFKFNEPF